MTVGLRDPMWQTIEHVDELLQGLTHEMQARESHAAHFQPLSHLHCC
jgi:hypothetical protein